MKVAKGKYSEKLVDLICEEVSHGKTLRQVCREQDVTWRAVYDWLNANQDFATRFARARELGEEAIAQECLDIADAQHIGEEHTIKVDGGIEVRKGDMLGHRKLQIETRLKLLAKWNPKKWGDKVEQTHQGPDGKPIVVCTGVPD